MINVLQLPIPFCLALHRSMAARAAAYFSAAVRLNLDFVPRSAQLYEEV